MDPGCVPGQVLAYLFFRGIHLLGDPALVLSGGLMGQGTANERLQSSRNKKPLAICGRHRLAAAFLFLNH